MIRDFHALSRSRMPGNTFMLARFLLQKYVVRVINDEVLAGRIVETEAYPPGDPAAHHYRRMTPRNRSLFLECGFSYVYRAYGTAWMLNVSSETEGVGAGVLIRALAPEIGTAQMAARRGNVAARDIARGPGRLAAALAVDGSLDGIDLCVPGALYLAAPPHPDAEVEMEIGVSVRIGLTQAADKPWRYFVRGSRFVSGPASLNNGPAGAPCP